MSAIDQFTDEQRQIIIREIARHRKEAEAIGYVRGKDEVQDATLADWIRGSFKSKLMWAGVGGTLTGLAGVFLPIVEGVLREVSLDPQTMAWCGALAAILRILTTKPLPQK